MFLSDLSLGIDLRKDHLILTLLKRSFLRVRLADHQVHALAEEETKEEREAHLINLLSAFISKHRGNRNKVFVSLPREKAIVRFLRLPIATKENLQKVLEYEVPRYTPFEREEVYFDYQILREEKGWLDVFAVFVKRGDVDSYLGLLKKVGIQPVSIQLPAIGALNLFFYHRRSEQNGMAVLLEVTGRHAEMNLVEGKEWKESLHLPLRVHDPEQTILRALRQSGWREDQLSKATLYIYGLNAHEKLFPSLGEGGKTRGLSLPPLHRIETRTGPSRIHQIYPAIGLPLRGLTSTKLHLNLLPFEMRKKVRDIGKPLSLVLASLAVILSMTWGAGVFFQYRNALRAIDHELKSRKPAVEAVEQLQKKRDALKKEIQEFEKIRSAEPSKVEILKELSDLLPPSVWIWNFKYSGREVEISGFADSASELISLLDRSPLFERVEFLAPVTKERERREGVDKERERFKIKLRLEGRGTGT